jgi:hypothetical protein
MARPGAYSLAIYRGDSFREQFSLSQDGQPVDLTGATAAAEIRGAPQSLPLYAFTCTIVDNVITIAMTAAETAVLPAHAYWDLQVTHATGEVQTFVAGGANVQDDITGSSAPGRREVIYA